MHGISLVAKMDSPFHLNPATMNLLISRTVVNQEKNTSLKSAAILVTLGKAILVTAPF